jgi:FkbM family methyltransferase
MQLALDEYKSTSGYMLYLDKHSKEYEPEVCMVLKSLLKEGDAFIDCGAHVGYFTILASELVGETGKVFAFEAEKENYNDLIANIKLNELKNIHPFHKAVGDKNIKAEIIYNRDNDGGHSLWNPSKHELNNLTRANELIKEPVKMVTIDSLIDEPVKLIKMDIEGCEFQALKGAEKLLKKHQPLVIIEVNDFALQEMGTSKEEIFSFMDGLKYNVFDLETGEYPKREGRYVYNVIFVRNN